jgi:hypothetical protein
MTGKIMVPEMERTGQGGAAKRRPFFHVILSASAFSSVLLGAVFISASFASASAACDATVNRAALQAVNKIPVIGQTTVLGQPFTIDPGVLRVEVDVFGPQSQVYDVDIRIDSDCRVLAATTRLDSESESPR